MREDPLGNESAQYLLTTHSKIATMRILNEQSEHF